MLIVMKKSQTAHRQTTLLHSFTCVCTLEGVAKVHTIIGV